MNKTQPPRLLRSSKAKLALTLLLCVAFLLATNGPAVAREKITWLYFNFPPLFVKTNNHPTGFGIEIMRRIWADMPDYSHSLVLATPGRMMKDLTDGKQVIVLGMLKTEKRLQVMEFSQTPCRLTSPNMVVMRKEDAKRLAPSGVVSIRKLFTDKNLTFVDIPEITYGTLQPIIDQHSHKTRILSTPEGVPHLIEMIWKKRADWAIVDPLATEYYIRKDGTEERVALVRIKESPGAMLTGYVAGPKTDWGKKTLARVDNTIRTLIQTETLYTLQEPYVPEGLKKSYRKAFDEKIRKTALGPHRSN